MSLRQLFTLNPEGSTVNFDVQAFKDPEQLLRIIVPVLQSVDATKLNDALNVRDCSLNFPAKLPYIESGRMSETFQYDPKRLLPLMTA